MFRLIWSGLLDFGAFLVFFYVLCIPGAPFALVAAAATFPQLLWLIPDAVVLDFFLACSLFVATFSLVLFGPSGVRFAGFRKKLVHRIIFSSSRRFRVWSGLLLGESIVSAIALPLLAGWTILRFGASRGLIDWLMAGEIRAMLPPLLMFFWIVIVVGRPHRYLARIPVLGPMLLRMQAIFILVVEGIRSQGGAVVDMDRVLCVADSRLRVECTELGAAGEAQAPVRDSGCL